MMASGTIARSLLSGTLGPLFCDCVENRHVAAGVLLILGFAYESCKMHIDFRVANKKTGYNIKVFTNIVHLYLPFVSFITFLTEIFPKTEKVLRSG
jgi:hypothetical protein